jgi:MFS family permease
MGSESAVIAGTVAMGFTKCAFILVAVLYLDRLGRRPLLLASTAGITASLACIAIAFSFLEHHGVEFPSSSSSSSSSSSTSAAFVVLFVCSYVAFFSIGIGPICWVLTAEIFPLRLRAQAMSLAVVINRLSSTLVSLTFLSLSSAISFTGTYLAFAAISLCSVAFVFALVPETKGRSLEEIAKFFSDEAGELPPPPPTPCPVHCSVEMMTDDELPLVDANGDVGNGDANGGGVAGNGGGVAGNGDVVVAGDGDADGDDDDDDEEGKVKLLSVPLSSDYR